jgi:hypothetical protein
MCGLSKCGIPHKVLRAMDAAPVPVGIHDPVDEVRIIGLGGSAINLSALSRRSHDGVANRESKQTGESHVDER